MISRFEALVLGALQGATEFLPVSSSGHLVIAQSLFEVREPVLMFDIVLHVGTLIAVVWFYRRDLLALLQQTFSGCGVLVRGGSWRETQRVYPGLRVAALLGAGSLPTAAIGLVFADRFERLFGSLSAVGMMLLVTAAILAVTRLAPAGGKQIWSMSLLDALLVGIAQGLAIAPGLSRSGATIGLALLRGVERETAARFSFLLSIPSILGALLFELGDAGVPGDGLALLLGFVSALIVGYFCLVFLVLLVKRGRFSWFAPYCLTTGLLALFLAARS